jgi:hypothetical protein
MTAISKVALTMDLSDNHAASARELASLHPAWLAFVHYCQELRYGEIERLSIQDGLPVLAEEVKRKIKFS